MFGCGGTQVAHSHGLELQRGPKWPQMTENDQNDHFREKMQKVSKIQPGTFIFLLELAKTLN